MDEHEGVVWVGLTPFVRADVRPPGVPAGLPTFLKISLRTHVRHPSGRDGLWFFSLEVACPPMPTAPGIGTPSHPGALDVTRREKTLVHSGRRWAGGSLLASRRAPRSAHRPADGAGRLADLAPAGVHAPARPALGDARVTRTVAAGRRPPGGAGADAHRLGGPSGPLL
ncbi:DUF2071 domain-containing protein [Streptomyces puniciscabiei]|uniref:DUF2071 domain-containing protein n=1 Tax=Streptomyces puniciscabiei TaxID=164348 RepID=UPI001F222E5A|nr:DUF2071 domain-containing protein [Streptomyces puniciscabiei]